MGFYFHAYPHNSVPSLHLHIVDLDATCTGPSYEMMKYKNMPAKCVIDVLRAELKLAVQIREALAPLLLSLQTKTATRKDSEELKGIKDDLSTMKAKTMYNMIEDVRDPNSHFSDRKLLFLSSKQADLIAQDPAIIRKMLTEFNAQQPRLVISLLPSLIRGFTRARLPPGDKKGVDKENEGIAALDRFMAEHIIPLAASTNAIIVCSAVHPYCVLSESLSRTTALVRSRWGSTLPFTIISCTVHLPDLYRVTRKNTTWSGIRDRSRVWKHREENGLKEALLKAAKEMPQFFSPLEEPEFDLDLDSNGTNFIIVDPTSEEDQWNCSYNSAASFNRLVTEIVRTIAAEHPSIAIKTGKSDFSKLVGARTSSALGLEMVLSMVEAGTPVLLLDLTRRLIMPLTEDEAEVAANQKSILGTNGAPQVDAATELKLEQLNEEKLKKERQERRCRMIEWHLKEVESEARQRVNRELPDYDWDVCMIAYFYDGALCAIRTAPRRTSSHTVHRVPRRAAPRASLCALLRGIDASRRAAQCL